MNENLDLVKILKDCPSGERFYSPIFGVVTFVRIVEDVKFPIDTTNGFFSADGKYHLNGECVLFPSKDQRDWSKWHRPFVNGDIVFYNDTIAIFKEWGDETLFRTYVAKGLNCEDLIGINTPLFGKSVRNEIRFATEEEKQILFKALEANGYKWNPETKTLEKLIVPKFKVGDKVRNKANGRMIGTIIALYEEVYEVKNPLGNEFPLDFRNQDNWELIPDKFNPKFFKPFDKVLVKHTISNTWCADLFSYYDEVGNYTVCTGEVHYNYGIPYNNDTKHLVGKSEEAPKFYRYWED